MDIKAAFVRAYPAEYLSSLNELEYRVLHEAFEKGVLCGHSDATQGLHPILIGLSLQLCELDAFGVAKPARNTEVLPVPAGWRTALAAERRKP